MSDRWVVALAMSVIVGAAHPSPVPLPAALALVAAALLVRHPLLLCLCAAVLASSLAARSLAGLDGIVTGTVEAEVVLLTDPRPSGGGLRADVRLGGRRVEARASGSAADALAPRLAGERVRVRGTVRPVSSEAPWLVTRHIGGRLTVHRVDASHPGDPVARLANGLRRTLASGAAPLTDRERSLFTGLVVGDDRAQPADLADDFLGAGMTHLLAVSGQNVAFVLALAAPLARRLRLWPRLGLTVAVVLLFGVITRFEPSVLRAAAMAGLAATVTTMGTPVSRLRIIGLAVTGLLLIDPLLVGSVGFRLSAAASAAILLTAPWIAAALPGPTLLREPLAVTIAAQLGVAPVLLATFGPVPVASLPANLLAVPVAGLVMVWGITAGMAAGVLGGAAAALLHGPTRLLVGWIEAVADRSAALPVGELGATHLAAATVGLGMAALATHRLGSSPAPSTAARWTAVRRVGLAVAALAVVVAALSAHRTPPLRSQLVPGVVRWHAAGTDVLVLGGAGWRSPIGVRSLLEGLRRHEVGTVDLVVVVDGDVPASAVEAVTERGPTGPVLAPPGHVPDPDTFAAVPVPPTGTEVAVGALVVRVIVVPDRLVVEARPR